MADIVERLRGKHRARTVTLPDILHEAADEIERLRSALTEMRNRDDRNGSLPAAYREILDAALTGHETGGRNG